jgi:hypothetical protein
MQVTHGSKCSETNCKQGCLAYMVCAGAIKLGSVAGSWHRVHGGPSLQGVSMEVTVIGRLTLKLHSVVCTVTNS